MDPEPSHPWLTVTAIEKSFGGVRALKGVTLDLRAGEVHGLVGENGAGKSTLGGIIGGVLRADRGRMLVDGAEVTWVAPRDALNSGVCYIAQELSIVPERTVLANVFLGNERAARGVVHERSLRRRYDALVARTGFDLPPGVRAGRLRLADQQKVEIMRALARDARLVIMDEPTASLGASDTAKLLEVIRDLRASGVCVVFVTHFLDEILATADRITVLKDGELVQTTDAATEDKESLMQAMLGSALGNLYPDRGAGVGDPVLEARHLTRRGEFTDVSFAARRGEIVGIAGLVGSGRTELVSTLAGVRRPDTGSVLLAGTEVRFRDVSSATGAGVVMVPEERKSQGLFGNLTVAENVTVPHLRHFTRFGFLRKKASTAAAQECLARVKVPQDRAGLPVLTLSGGNQQKVLFARWLARKPTVLIADEPTRGVDVGARAAIYRTLRSLADDGVAVIVVSSDNDEVAGLTDRLYVMRGGAMVAEMPSSDATEERLLGAMLDVNLEEDR